MRFTILLLSAVLSGAHAESSLLEIKGAKLKDPENASVLISDSGVCSIEDSRKPSFCGMYDTIRNFSAAWERSGRLCKEHFIPLDLPIPNPDGRTLVSLSGEGTALLLRCGARKSSGEDSPHTHPKSKRIIVAARSVRHVVVLKHHGGKSMSPQNVFLRRGSINTFGIDFASLMIIVFWIFDALRSG